MATRSAIGIKHGTRIKAIYCHYDGYLEQGGRALYTHYQDSVKVNKLIAQGDMSTIGAEIGEKHSFNQRSEYGPDGIAEQCTFYGRDRGEDNVGFQSFGSEAEFVNYYSGSGCEFYYLYDHGVWYYSTGQDFAPLHESAKVKELANV
jgi:hypothetical protein